MVIEGSPDCAVQDELAQITIEVSVAVATVNPVFPLTVPDVAVILIGVEVVASAVASPPLATVATAVFDEVHVAVAVRSCVVLLGLYVPVALNCVRVPTGTVELSGVTAIEISAGVELEPEPPPHPAISTTIATTNNRRRFFMGEGLRARCKFFGTSRA